MRKFALLVSILILSDAHSFSQGCCSGGCGNPIAGGASPGVLGDKQMEIGSSFQYIDGNKFLAKDKDTATLFDDFNSKYIYSRIAYGVTKNLTVSVETGYFINKTKIGLDKIDNNRSSGIGDLILFPKYDVFNRSNEKKRIEITFGLGYKIPLGKHNDSTFTWFDSTKLIAHYTTSPPLVQPTTGSQDIILYGFFFRGFPQHNFRIFANTTYIRKGWNSLGEKFGDYASVSLFAGKTFFKKIGVTLQIKNELIKPMQAAKNVDLVSFYNVDVRSTGSKKIFFVPQISFSQKSFSIFAQSDIPLYEYVYGVQVAKLHQFTVGVSYRFSVVKKFTAKDGEVSYICPMKCEGSESNEPGKCKVCGMEKVKK